MRDSLLFFPLLAFGLAGACSSTDDPTSSPPAAQATGDAGAGAVVSVHPLDTAILFPLPQTEADDSLLRVDAAGAKGALLPSYASDMLPALGGTKNAETFARLRLVSANIDPCFPSGVDGKVDEAGVSQCRKQLRLIFQPVIVEAGTLTTEDISVHTFYEMDKETFTRMTREIVTARGAAPLGDGAIDVHPVLAQEGLSGPYAKAIEAIFLRYGGAESLVKVTFSGLRAGIGWQMGGIDFVGTKGKDMVVPETKVTREEMINNGTNGDFDATVDPQTKFSKGLGVLLRSTNARSATDAEVRASFVQALQIDNPETELHPGTVDCASCHLATPTRWWAERNRGLDAKDFPESYKNERWNLENRSANRTNTASTRCFGYYERDVAISQRTVNEAAAVADFINAKILGGEK